MNNTGPYSVLSVSRGHEASNSTGVCEAPVMLCICQCMELPGLEACLQKGCRAPVHLPLQRGCRRLAASTMLAQRAAERASDGQQLLQLRCRLGSCRRWGVGQRGGNGLQQLVQRIKVDRFACAAGGLG